MINDNKLGAPEAGTVYGHNYIGHSYMCHNYIGHNYTCRRRLAPLRHRRGRLPVRVFEKKYLGSMKTANAGSARCRSERVTFADALRRWSAIAPPAAEKNGKKSDRAALVRYLFEVKGKDAPAAVRKDKELLPFAEEILVNHDRHGPMPTRAMPTWGHDCVGHNSKQARTTPAIIVHGP